MFQVAVKKDYIRLDFNFPVFEDAMDFIQTIFLHAEGEAPGISIKMTKPAEVNTNAEAV